MTTAIVVGSGPNGLSAAITLAAAGVEVTVLEASATPGGGARSAELTLPGLIHDECSGFHPLSQASALFAEHDLSRHGLEWAWSVAEYGHPLDGGRGAVAYRSVPQTVAGLGAGGVSWRRLLGPLAESFTTFVPDLMGPVVSVPSHPFHLAGFGMRAALPVAASTRLLEGDEARALFAGAAAHAMRDFATPFSSAVGIALATSAHAFGWPVAVGGTGAITAAMIAELARLGGRLETGTAVTSLADLKADIVMLDVAPSAVVSLAGAALPRRVARAYTRYRHGPGAFKVEYAVEGGVPWEYDELRGAGTVHLGGDLAEVSSSERAVSRGRMPERPFVLLGQQAVADPTRGRDGVVPIYSYAHVPAGFTGDATEAITTQIERFAPGFRERIRATAVRTTTEMSTYNANYIGGDIVTGANDLQQLVFRPRVTLDPYSTGIPGVFICSAATPPGAGAHGVCGYNAAKRALRSS